MRILGASVCLLTITPDSSPKKKSRAPGACSNLIGQPDAKHWSRKLVKWCGVVAFAPMVTDNVTVYGLSLALHPHEFRPGPGTRSIEQERRDHPQFSSYQAKYYNVPEKCSIKCSCTEDRANRAWAALGLWVINDLRGIRWIRTDTTGQGLTAH